MTRYELQARLEAAEKQDLGLLDEIKNLKEKLAEMQDEQEIPDKPEFEMDEKFYYLSSVTNNVEDGCHGGDTGFIDFNMFHTQEYAHEFRRKFLLIAMMLHCMWYLCYKHHPDFNDGDIQKWTVVFDYKKRKFTVEFSRTREWSTVYFDTERNAQKCADWLNSHWKENDNDA